MYSPFTNNPEIKLFQFSKKKNSHLRLLSLSRSFLKKKRTAASHLKLQPGKASTFFTGLKN